MTLAAFIAGFVAAGLPVGLGNSGDYASRANRLDFAVPAGSFDVIVRESKIVLQTANIQSDVETNEPLDWLDNRWATLSLITHDSAEQDRARTAIIVAGLWGPELRLSDDLPIVWLLRDGIAVGLLVLPIAVLVALASMLIGAIARIFDQRETLVALNLAGTPQSVLLAAQRYEMILPTILLGSIAAIAGLIAGSTLGLVNILNPYTIGIFLGLLTLGSLSLLLADRATQPILKRVSSDLSERE